MSHSVELSLIVRNSSGSIIDYTSFTEPKAELSAEAIQCMKRDVIETLQALKDEGEEEGEDCGC